MSRSPRYEPRRRAAEPGRRRIAGRHRTSTRYVRLLLLSGAAAITMVVAVVAIAFAPSPTLVSASAGETRSAGVGALLAGIDRARELSPGVSLAPEPQATSTTRSTALSAASGSGKRIVFDMSSQRVWLVEKNDKVRRTYAVSGSRSDNLHPGSFRVYSRSRHAVGFDRTSTMDYFVRFTRGKNAAIGFHDIPVNRAGNLVQRRSQLGEPTSSGCIRQQRADAKALWEFAPVGTKVVVLS